MQAAILVGGLGTRLGDHVRDRPKPLLDVAGKPFVEHLIYMLRRHGITNIVLLAGYRAEVVEHLYGPQSGAAERLGVDISVQVEQRPAGTAGALIEARHLLADEFFLLNGDSIFDFNILDLTAPPPGNSKPLITMGLLPIKDARRYGLVDIASGYVTAFREKPLQPAPGLVNAGVYWVNRSVLNRVKQIPCSLEQEIFPGLVDERCIAAKIHEGYFIDIGIPEDLSRANVELTAALTRPAIFFDRDDTLIHDSGYTHLPEDLRWIEGVPEMIKRLNDARILVFVATNQAGVAKGHYDEGAITKFHANMDDELLRIGAHIDDYRYCPHHEDGTVAAYTKPCNWRKPGDGMLRDLLAHWPVDRGASLVLGDKDSDVAAGIAAGLTARCVDADSIVETVDLYLDDLKQSHRI